MVNGPIRVAIIGPESSGKTTLAQALTIILSSDQIKARCVLEYAREYYGDRPYQPCCSDILAIARGQLAAEHRAANGATILFCDSTVTTCKIWSEVVFGYVEPALLALHRPSRYDLTVLVRPDIPWEFDPLRSDPYARDSLFALYQAELARHEIRCLEVGGAHQNRVACVLHALQVGVSPVLKM